MFQRIVAILRRVGWVSRGNEFIVPQGGLRMGPGDPNALVRSRRGTRITAFFLILIFERKALRLGGQMSAGTFVQPFRGEIKSLSNCKAQ